MQEQYNKHHQPFLVNIFEKSSSSWVTINKHALAHNIEQYKNIVRPALLAVVIKSNAYGHGIELMAKLCEENIHVDYLCTVNTQEALFLRSIGIKKPILVLSIVHHNLEEVIAADIDLVLYDSALAYELNALGKKVSKQVHVHIKVDTGLSRLGLHNDQAYDFIVQLQQLPFITIRGIFTHFADSENADQTFVNYQMRQFTHLLDRLQEKNITIPFKHTSCSAATTAYKNCHFNFVRVGIGIYGLWPSDHNKQITEHYYPHFSLKPVLQWKTTIIQIKEIPAGSFVGYDRTYRAYSNETIAVIPIGYWDGYDRELSNKASVIINNRLAPIVGRIAMNIAMVNITGIQAAVGDEVIILGNQVGITADDLARHCNTINYEIVTRINPLLPRIIE